MKKIDLAVVFALCVFSATAFAQRQENTCAPVVYESVKRILKVNEFSPRQNGGNVISAACRIWPYKTNLLLAAFAYDGGVEYEKQSIVLVIDQKTWRVSNSFRHVIGEDAITEVGERSLNLDTAKYQLTENIRAFGVRFISSARGASCGEAYWGNELTLFVPEKKTLRPVLTLNLYQQRWLQGCPRGMSQKLWEDAELTISMANTSTNGFYDLEVTAKITVNADGASTGKHRDRTEQHMLRYDGTTYQKGQLIPWWLEI